MGKHFKQLTFKALKASNQILYQKKASKTFAFQKNRKVKNFILFKSKLFNHFTLNLSTQKKEKRSIKKTKMAAEMKSNQTIEEMTKMSALELVSQSDFYRKEEKQVKSVQADDVKIARQWSTSLDDQFYDSNKKCTIM